MEIISTLLHVRVRKTSLDTVDYIKTVSYVLKLFCESCKVGNC